MCNHSGMGQTKAQMLRTSRHSQSKREPAVVPIWCHFYCGHGLKRQKEKKFIEIALKI